MKKLNNIVFFSLLFTWFMSCTPGKGIEELPSADRGPMLVNYSENLIRPGYQTLQTSVSNLQQAAVNFNASRTTSTLQLLRAAFQQTYTQWQYVSLYDFGPALTVQLIPEGLGVNTFPTDGTRIEANITAGGYDFNSSLGSTFSGFPALDYLLYSKSLTDAEIITLFDDDKRRTFLVDVIEHIDTKVAATLAEWNGTYRNTFTSNLGVDVGSSTSNVINRMVRNLEIVKNFKVGVPVNIIANVLGDPSVVNPSKAEAYYSDSSLTQMRASLLAIKNTYLGVSTQGVNGPGLDDYLQAIGQSNLDASIKGQFVVVENKLSEIPETFSQSLSDVNHRAKIREFHAELVALIALMKVDMTSAVGVMISYTDNDGD